MHTIKMFISIYMHFTLICIVCQGFGEEIRLVAVLFVRRFEWIRVEAEESVHHFLILIQ